MPLWRRHCDDIVRRDGRRRAVMHVATIDAETRDDDDDDVRNILEFFVGKVLYLASCGIL